MQGYEVTQSSTAYPLVFLMISSSDHITGLTGATVTVTISKNGGAFASPSGAVTEIGNGWYKVAGNATDTGTLGPLLLHATATGADPTDMMFPVVAINPQSATNYGITDLDATISSRMATFSLPANFASLAITAGGAVTAGTVSDKTGYSLATAPPTAAQVATAVWQDATAGDFTAAGSIGKALFVNAAPGAAGGHFIAGSNAATTANFTGNLSGSVGSVTGSVGSVTGNVGGSVANVTGAVGSVTGNVGGNVVGSVASVTGAVGSVTGNVGGNVVGSVASVTAAVTVSLTQTLGTPRALDAIADGSMQLNDALWCAVAAAAGKESVTGTTYLVQTPSTGTTLRTFTLDSGTAPTSRS